MKKRMTQLGTLLLALLLLAASAQSDELRFDAETGVLTLDISYDRALANAEARDCSRLVFENGLLHSVLRNLFLYLPLEASYLEGVDTVEVRVLQAAEDAQEDLVLRAAAPLDTLRQTNVRFRSFMNAFASPRTGACFAVSGATLQQWLNTLNARGGALAFDIETFESEFEGLLSLEEVALDAPASDTPTSAAPEEASANAAVSEAEASEADVLEADAPAASEAAAAPGDFEALPYLGEEPRREFTAPELVLEDGLDYAARIETTKGTLVVDLFETRAPLTVNNFVFLALNRFYEGILFHRVLEGFIAQTGDPLGSGAGGPGYVFADEISPDLSHAAAGVVSVANAGPGTNGSQFFITLGPATYLDGQYNIFGAVTEGLEVLEALSPTDPNAPAGVGTLDSTLGLLETQGVDFAGGDSLSFEAYLLETLGEVPEDGLRFPLGDYDVLLATDPNTGQRLVAFWPLSDRLLSVEIVVRGRAE